MKMMNSLYRKFWPISIPFLIIFWPILLIKTIIVDIKLAKELCKRLGQNDILYFYITKDYELERIITARFPEKNVLMRNVNKLNDLDKKVYNNQKPKKNYVPCLIWIKGKYICRVGLYDAYKDFKKGKIRKLNRVFSSLYK